MKCINRKLTCLLLLCLLLPGCGEKNKEVTFSDAYQIYQTSQKYQMVSVEDTSLQNTYPFFAD